MKTTSKNYAEALAGLLETQPADKTLVSNFMSALRKARQEKMLNRILQLCEKILMRKNGEIKIRVISPKELSAKQIEKLKKMIEQSTNLKPIIEQKLEKSLRGGVKLAVLDYMIDATISGRLQSFARYLMSNGYSNNHAARGNGAERVKM